MSKEVGIEDKDFKVHELVTFPNMWGLSCYGQVAQEDAALGVGTCGWVGDRQRGSPKSLLTD